MKTLSEPNLSMGICFKNGIKVYPITCINKFKIQISLNDKPVKTYDKLLTSKEVNDAMAKTYAYYGLKM